MAIKIKLIIVHGDALLTKFMQCADVFEEWKVLGEVEELTITFKEEETKITFARCQRLINKIAADYPKELILSLIHLYSIVEEDKILLNTKGKCKPYINKSVKVISDGYNWGMFHEYLTKLGIEFSMDIHCFVL